MMEEWRAVVGFEGAYEVSNLGRVRSLTRSWLQESRHGTTYVYNKNGRLLRPGRMPGGHYSVAIGRGNSLCVHDLVLSAFQGPRPPGWQARHLNGWPSDNRDSNLVWAPKGPNEQDKKWHRVPRGCLSAGEALAIRLALHAKQRGVDIAADFGVSPSTISKINKRKVHADVHFAP